MGTDATRHPWVFERRYVCLGFCFVKRLLQERDGGGGGYKKF